MGSNDGNNWIIIKEHRNDTTFNTPKQSHTWTIQNCNQSYRMFRIYMTDKNSHGYWYLSCHGFEIYGHLTDTK